MRTQCMGVEAQTQQLQFGVAAQMISMAWHTHTAGSSRIKTTLYNVPTLNLWNRRRPRITKIETHTQQIWQAWMGRNLWFLAFIIIYAAQLQFRSWWQGQTEYHIKTDMHAIARSRRTYTQPNCSFSLSLSFFCSFSNHFQSANMRTNKWCICKNGMHNYIRTHFCENKNFTGKLFLCCIYILSVHTACTN